MSKPIQAAAATRRLVELETEVRRLSAERDRLQRELQRLRALYGPEAIPLAVPNRDRHAL